MAIDGANLDHGLAQVLNRLSINDSFPVYGGAFLDKNPVDVFRCYITSELARLTGNDSSLIYGALAWPTTPDKGDLTFAVPRLQDKTSTDADTAARLAQTFPVNKLINPPETFGVTLRFDFNPNILPQLVLPQVLDRGSQYGSNELIGLQNPEDPQSPKRKIVIEFGSPNIAKEFHIGHLRSPIIGGFLSNLYESLGFEVVRLNYLGDWGRQFGLVAVGWDKYGSEELLQHDPTGHLVDVYTKINADFKPEDEAYKAAKKRGENTAHLESQGILGASKRHVQLMEEGNEEVLAQWKKFCDLSIERYKKTYARLNIIFDKYDGESQVKSDTMAQAERILQEQGITEMSDGANTINFKNHGAKKLGVAILRSRTGTSTYLLRDVGAAIQRLETWGMDSMTYVVMSEQDVHVQQFIKILDLMGGEYSQLSKKIAHVNFGKVQGMSTRKGNVKFLADVLDDVQSAMHLVMRGNATKYSQVDNPEETADHIGISSILVQDMSGKRINNYHFDMQRMLSFEGDTGPYLQYAHARLCSISRKTGYTATQLREANFSLLHEKHAIGIVRLLASWPDRVLHAYKTLEPSTILGFLFRLAHQVSSSYDVLKVVNAEEGPEVSQARAALFEAARQVIYNGMVLLGLTPVHSM
ncbi:MAG: hypothetical protein M1831_003192 [Alyxoria varia]|nr:MAG: hypothetical protein M1831_003192 [Alyxoria varia]